jgi:diguanylate cyclase (GGDEF)-like protein
MPLPLGRGGEAAPPLLAVLNHRGERLASTCAWFQERGWEVRTTADLTESQEVLQRGAVRAALIYPLTLLRDGLEWQMLAQHLSPAKPVPWIVVPWAEAPVAALAQLLAASPAVADFVRTADDWPEMGARLGHLVAVQDQVTRTLARAAELEGQLVTDHKTGLANDRHFRERMREEFDRAQRHRLPASLILLDLDYFKQINDAHSYEYGDAVLAAVGEVLRASVRSIDIAARIGGDEFAVILPSTKSAEALAVARRVQTALRETAIGLEARRLILAASQGVATADGGQPRDPRQWFLQANEALKAAKRAGRDRIFAWDPRSRSPASPEEPAPGGA